MRNVNRRHNGAVLAAPATATAAAFVAVATLLLLLGPKSALSSPVTNGAAHGNELQQEQEVGEGAVKDEPPDPQLSKQQNNNGDNIAQQQQTPSHIQLPSKVWNLKKIEK